MSFELDTYSVLRTIGANPDIFASLREDLVRTAPSLVERQLRSCGGDINGLRAVYQVLGKGLFVGVIESLDVKRIAALLRRFDRYNPALKGSMTAAWGAAHLHALADGTAEPAAAPAKRRRSRRRKDPFDTVAARALFTPAMAADGETEFLYTGRRPKGR